MVKSTNFKAKRAKTSTKAKLLSLTRSQMAEIKDNVNEMSKSTAKDQKHWILEYYSIFSSQLGEEELFPLKSSMISDFVIYLFYECHYKYLTIRNSILPYFNETKKQVKLT